MSARLTVSLMLLAVGSLAGGEGLESKGLSNDLLAKGDSKGDFWRDIFQGELYKNEKNPWVDGNDTDGSDFNGNFEEFRRLRINTEVGFLTAFKASLGLNLIEDDRFESSENRLEFSSADYASAYLRVSVDKLINLPFLDKLSFTYGRQKIRVGYESHRSSNKLATVERTALSDRIRGTGSRRTGLVLSAAKDDVALNFGVFSHDESDFVGAWNQGHFLYGNVEWEFADDWTILIDGVTNQPEGPDEALEYDWVGSLSVLYEGERLGMSFNFSLGDNGDEQNQVFDSERQGRFYGMVFTPWYWLLEERLQLVTQVQYQTADEPEGIRLGDRYLIPFDDRGTAEVNNGRGDDHFSAYVGLNFHPWKGESRLMIGVQYDDLATPDGNLDAFTTFLAIRTSF